MISKIYHISDIHVRNLKRHDEYKAVFDRLFEYIDQTKDDDCVIVLAGDIVHSKTDMSPELVSVVSKFFKSCADRLPTVLITGNHDRLTNFSRLDALSPIVESLSHPNLHYWKMAGVYNLNGVSFSVLSIADRRENWVLAKDFDADYKIALYHGPIIGALNDQGIVTGGYGISVETFDGFDLGICGDQHRFQYMNWQKTVGFSSSLIGQNYAEHPTRHGILVWDLHTRAAKFIQIDNDHAFVTFVLNDGECEIPAGLPKNLRVRIQHQNSTPLQIQSFLDKLSLKYNVVETIKQKVNKNNSTSIHHDRLFGNSRNPDYQNELICSYLSQIEPGITDDELSDVKGLNVETNKSLNVKSVARDTIWKPKRLIFSNMFSYGEDNEIDFTELDGLYGLWGQNAIGKSSILGIICYALYDKAPTTTKSVHVLNVNKDNFYCKLQLEFDGVDYYIERIGTRKPDGNVRVDVNFWWIDSDGKEVSLNGEDRDKTNYAIREYIGQYEDFLMTSLSTQYDNQSFVEKSQKERKELLYKFLDISIYDDLYRIAKEVSREYQILIRDMEREDLNQKTMNLSTMVDRIESDMWHLNDELSKVNKIKESRTLDLIELNRQLVPIDRSLNPEQIRSQITKIDDQIAQIRLEWDMIKNQLKSTRKEIIDIKKSLSRIKLDGDYDEIMKSQAQYTTECIRIKNELAVVEAHIKSCENKQEHLSKHEYNPDCEFCVKNSFVIDAKDAMSRLPELRGRYMRLQIELSHYSGEVDILALWFSKFDEHRQLQSKLNTAESQFKLLTERSSTCKYKLKSLSEQSKGQYKKLKQCDIIASQMTQNAALETKISVVNKELGVIDKKYEKTNESYKQRFSEYERTKKEYEDCVLKLNTYIDYIKKYRIYELYLKALSRDGVPYKILQAVMPVIENEVNIILQQIVDFTIKLECADEKYIHAFIVRDESQSWPIELSSGMERFILSLAFRQALSEITSLPRANFMAIDEGFGVLDSDNLASMGKLLNYLKTQYDYLLIISHIDSVRDLVDKQIRIDKVDGYSKILI